MKANPFDPRVGATGQFAARADIAYCLGPKNKSHYQDLTKIAEIRNTFAHKHVSLNFNNSIVRESCGKLEGWRILQDEDDDDLDDPSPEQLHSLARNQFNLSVVLIGTRIHLDVLSQNNSKNRK